MKKIILVLLLLFFSLKSSSQIVELATGLVDPGRITLNGTDLYYTDDDSVFKIDLLETNPTSQLLALGLDNPNGLTVKDNELYIAEFDGYRISKINLNDPNYTVQLVSEPINRPNFMLWRGDELFWSNNTSSYVGKLTINGGNVSTDLVAAATSGFTPFGIAFLNDTTLYIANYSTNTLDVINPTEQSITPTQFMTGFQKPFGLRMYGTTLYIVEQDAGKISAIDFSVSNPSVIDVLTGLNKPLDIEVDDNYLYIIEENPNRVIRSGNILSVNEFDNDNLRIHPNPTNDKLTINGIKNPIKYSITDISGKLILEGNLTNFENTIEVIELQSGVYFLVLNQSKPMRFIKN